MYCSKCGAKIQKNSEFCSECGNSVKESTSNEVNTNSGSSIGWGILGFFIPMVGLILFLVWKNDRPSDAKAAGIGALINVVLGIALVILSILMFFIAISAAL